MGFRLKDIKLKDILQVSDLVIPKHSITCIIGESGSAAGFKQIDERKLEHDPFIA